MFSSCGQTDKTKEKDDLKKVTIDFAEAVIEIPDFYRLISPDDLKNELLSSDKPNNVIQTSIQKIEKLKSMPTDFIIYADTANFENNLWFQEGEHVRLTKSLSQQYLGMLEKQLGQTWTPQGIEYERIESKFISRSNNQVIKLKYKLTHDDFSRFTTQYIVSGKSKTIGIVVNDLSLKDYEILIKGMKMK